MGELRGSDENELFHKGCETYQVSDLYEYGMHILRQSGQAEKSDVVGECVIRRWGEDDSSRFQGLVFARGLESNQSIYVYVADKFQSDEEQSTYMYKIDGPMCGDISEGARIQVLDDERGLQVYRDEGSEYIKAALSDIFMETGEEGPLLNEAGRERYWEGVASMALDNAEVNSIMLSYAEEMVSKGGEYRNTRVESEIANVALSQVVEMDSSSFEIAYSSLPEHIFKRHMDMRISEIEQYVRRYSE